MPLQPWKTCCIFYHCVVLVWFYDCFDARDGSELEGRVLRVNRAKPLKHKLGSMKAVWNADDWFQNMPAGDETINLTSDDLPRSDSLQPVKNI
mmetsp:Transcript_9610/g.14451  ORF Transcript_9610/g.14451 Transcript_9610/m.14451 type:complete len:93 (+) Transcript_9610:252-530(+)